MASNNGSNGTVQTARPRIVVAGSDVPALADGLLSLVVAEDTQGLYRCEAGFGNWGTKANAVDFLYYDRKTIDFGKPFQVKVDADVIFDGRVMALEGHFPRESPPQLVLLAEDRFQDLRMTRRSRSFADIDDTGVFNQIASEHKLTPKVNVQGPKHRVLAQVNQSDLAFLRERAARSTPRSGSMARRSTPSRTPPAAARRTRSPTGRSSASSPCWPTWRTSERASRWGAGTSPAKPRSRTRPTTR